MITLKDVAALAGVSTATVSLVLNGRPGVNAATRVKVRKASRSLGYTPNSIAQRLATKRSRTIGLVVTDIENPFFASITKYVDQFVKEAGYGLILEISDDEIAGETRCVEDLVGKMVEGLVIVPTLRTIRTDFSPFQRLRALRIPYVFLTSYYPGHRCPCVMMDLERGSQLVTAHLAALGHRDIVLLTSHDTRAVPADLRIRGFRRALSESGRGFSDDMIVRCGETTFKNGYEETRALLRRRRPEAIMAINDILALGACRAIREAGLRVPADVAVAGFDDVVFASISEVPLTTVRQDVPALCQLAVSVLFKALEGGDPPRTKPATHLLPPELVVRASTSITAPRFSGGAGGAPLL